MSGREVRGDRHHSAGSAAPVQHKHGPARAGVIDDERGLRFTRHEMLTSFLRIDSKVEVTSF